MRLQDLIKERKHELRLTWAQMVVRSADAGYSISRPVWHYWTNREWGSVPPTDVLLGIAAALDIEPEAAFAAAGESIGIHVHHVETGEYAAGHAGTDVLTPEENEAMVQTLRRVADLLDQHDAPAARTDTGP